MSIPGFGHIDLDEVFAYHTVKCVKMLDRRLGMIYHCMNLCIIWYMIAYVFIAKESYLEIEPAIGQMDAAMKGSTYSVDLGVAKIWDTVDLMKPPRENGAMFVATKVVTTAQQKQGNCSNPFSKCSKDADCRKSPPLTSGKCVGGQCEALQWCPAEAESDPQATSISVLETIPEWNMNIHGAIQFPRLQKGRVFSTISTDTNIVSHPQKGANQLKVKDLLDLAGTTYENVKQTGCVLNVVLWWSCELNDIETDCEPEIRVERLDTSEKNKGFEYRHAEYYREGSESTRDYFTFTGIRLVLSSIGLGKKMSLAMVVMQVGSAIALCKLSSFTADFLLLYVMPEKEHYRTFKEERTADFSDVKKLIKQVEAEAMKLKMVKDRFKLEEGDEEEEED